MWRVQFTTNNDFTPPSTEDTQEDQFVTHPLKDSLGCSPWVSIMLLTLWRIDYITHPQEGPLCYSPSGRSIMLLTLRKVHYVTHPQEDPVHHQ